MNIPWLIKEANERINDPERKEVKRIVEDHSPLFESSWTRGGLPLNERIQNLSQLIQHLEKNYNYVPPSLYRKLVNYNFELTKKVNKKFKKEYTLELA